ncbi:MAG: hypothetical protein Q9187_008211 [Circinaria calcarea]
MPSNIIDLEEYFLQPAEDSRIQNSIISLERSIATHVYNYYSNMSYSSSNEKFLKAISVGDDIGLIPQSALDIEEFQLALIQRTLTHSIVKNIAIDGDPETTFLPKQIVALLKMAPPQTPEPFRFGASSILRRTAANLLRLQQKGESDVFADFQRCQVRKASEVLHNRFSALANPTLGEGPRMDQLEAIVSKAAQLGVLLLMQPATFEFDWLKRYIERSTGSSLVDKVKARPDQIEGLMVFPALIKTGDNTGRKLRKPEIICRPVYEYIDEDD